MKYICANSPTEFVYKDVVIIGNGPSGITLSYMLAGNWPYWNKNDVQRHPDELLSARLCYADGDKSLVEQDLIQLAEGLEGRSTNPVSLLLDSLQNPCADIGLEVPSMLKYRYQPDKEIDHVVLGTGPPGGSWHRMNPNLRTLSLSAWMSLPGLDFNAWCCKQQLSSNEQMTDKRTSTYYRQHQSNGHGRHANEHEYEHGLDYEINLNRTKCEQSNWWQCFAHRTHDDLCTKCDRDTAASVTETNTNVPHDLEVKLTNSNATDTKIVRTPVPRRNLSVRRQVSREVETRALVSKVAEYYKNYVREMSLERFFRNNTLVTSVKPYQNAANKDIRWLVRGIQSNGAPFAYACRNVVLANGASDLANHLGVNGENTNEWINHDLQALVSVLEKIPETKRSELNPVLVVGAGLSAADAVSICRSSGIQVIHVYRNRSAGLDKMLPETVYPEYHEVHKMMKDCVNTYDRYSPMPEHTIVEFQTDSQNNLMPCNRVVLKQLNSGELTTVNVSFCAILIGFRPDLHFLDSNAKLSDDNKYIKLDSAWDHEEKPNGYQLSRQCQLLTVPAYNLLSRKIAWLKNLCAKCRHLSLCERSRRYELNHEHRSRCVCINNARNKCQQSPTNNPNRPNDNNNNHQIVHSDDSQKSITRHISTAATIAGTTIATADNLNSVSKPNVSLGEDSTKPIDCKTNPIAVDKFTNEVQCINVKGLYAMGPLVGDNFIRFIPGGALAITSALNKMKR